jgi:hypothetical protein
MRKAKQTRKTYGEMSAEYRFDYTRSRPNRFASRAGKHTIAIVLEPDVAKVFKRSESVNRLLRSVISAIPNGRKSPTNKTRKLG